MKFRLAIIGVLGVFMALFWYSLLAIHKKSRETQIDQHAQSKVHAKKIVERMENLYKYKIVVISIPSGKMAVLSHSIDENAVNVFVTHHREDGEEKFVPRITVKKYDGKSSISMDDDNSDGKCDRGTFIKNDVVKKSFAISYDGRIGGKKHQKFFNKEYAKALKLITEKL